ncbi:c-type cytochrome [Luteolibacter marinus]|uniref:c-type cytochrome n=1 Tax=Luteolibacter marinus TaxID=2776705 RepID=UPI00186613E6|nr:cytochrome c [Luteolibacter marinus]
MSSTSDNPLVRFAAFWWGLGVFSLFGVILLAIKLFTGNDDSVNPLEEAVAAKRYDARAAVDAAQAANLGYKEVEKGKVVQVPPTDVFGLLGKELVAAKPAAVEKPEQIVPGSDRQLAAADAPPSDFGAVDEMTPAADAEIDPAVIEAGKAQYMAATCFVCHGMNGEGGPLAPPLAASDWVTGPVSNLIRIQFRGLMGPITVSGKEYNLPAPMAPLSQQTDEQVASVLTYIRNSFGNKASAVLPEQVKMLRSEVGKPMLTADDLIKP